MPNTWGTWTVTRGRGEASSRQLLKDRRRMSSRYASEKIQLATANKEPSRPHEGANTPRVVSPNGKSRHACKAPSSIIGGISRKLTRNLGWDRPVRLQISSIESLAVCHLTVEARSSACERGDAFREVAAVACWIGASEVYPADSAVLFSTRHQSPEPCHLPTATIPRPTPSDFAGLPCRPRHRPRQLDSTCHGRSRHASPIRDLDSLWNHCGSEHPSLRRRHGEGTKRWNTDVWHQRSRNRRYQDVGQQWQAAAMVS